MFGVLLPYNKGLCSPTHQPNPISVWGFPKGKVNEGEDPLDCARREIYEEVGYIVKDHQVSKSRFFQHKKNSGKRVGMFVVLDVEKDFEFEPRVIKEIGDIQWWPLSMVKEFTSSAKNTTDVVLSAEIDEASAKNQDKKAFWGISPFVNQLCTLIKKLDLAEAKKKAKKKKKKRSSGVAVPVVVEEEEEEIQALPDLPVKEVQREDTGGLFKLDVKRTLSVMRPLLYAV